MLEDLATGPRGDALALWTTSKFALASSPASSRTVTRAKRATTRATALMACWTIPYSRRATARPRPQTIVRNASIVGAAIDPGTGTAVIAWREPTGAIRYALGRPSRS